MERKQKQLTLAETAQVQIYIKKKNYTSGEEFSFLQ